MKLYFRLLWTFLRLLLKPARLQIGKPFERSFKVHFADLDFNWHMTNSRYVAMLDLMRYEVSKRSGLWNTAMKKKLMPVLSASYLRYRRELRVGQKFVIRLEQIYADGTWFYFEYKFIRDGVVHCHALEKIGFHERGVGRIPPAHLAELAGSRVPLAEPAPHIVKWIEVEAELSKVVRQGS